MLSEQITLRLLLASAATLGGVAIVLAQRAARAAATDARTYADTFQLCLQKKFVLVVIALMCRELMSAYDAVDGSSTDIAM